MAEGQGGYREMIKVKQARLFDFGTVLMRMYSNCISIALISMLTLAGHTPLAAATVVLVVALCIFVISPRVSKLIDARGQSKVVPFAAAAAMLGTALLLIIVQLDLPLWLCYPAGVLVGFLPNPSALARTRWTFLIRTNRSGAGSISIKTAYSYEGVLDDIGFVLGPSLSIAVAAATIPIGGMLMSASCYLVGTVFLLASRSTEPIPGWVAESDEAADDAAEPVELSEQGGRKRKASVFSKYPGVRLLASFTVLSGALYGILDTSSITFCESIGAAGYASVVLVCCAIVSIASGTLFGMLHFKMHQARQEMLFAVLFGVTYISLALIDGRISLLVVQVICAVFFPPFLITNAATCERMVPGNRLTEALTCITSGASLGEAVGPTIAGIFIQIFAVRAGFFAGAGIAVLFAVLGVVSYPYLRKQIRE